MIWPENFTIKIASILLDIAYDNYLKSQESLISIKKESESNTRAIIEVADQLNQINIQSIETENELKSLPK